MIEVFSPAKINWFFCVQNKRPDGFHNMTSIMSTLNWGDNLTFSRAQQDSYQSNSKLSWNDNNLIVKAVQHFRQKTQQRYPIQITHEQNIIEKAGLGGGSSNAASTLWALNTLFSNPLSIEELKQLGAQIGADVPFFFSSGQALVQGFGDRVENALPFIERTIHLAIPQIEGPSTEKVYKHCIAQEETKGQTQHIVDAFFSKKPLFINDLEPSAFRLTPQLSDFKNALGPDVGMTGSGVGFFSLNTLTPLDGVTHHTVKTIVRQETAWYHAHSATAV